MVFSNILIVILIVILDVSTVWHSKFKIVSNVDLIVIICNCGSNSNWIIVIVKTASS